ncbi:MAG: hypothetical protein KC457_04440 [Myxococcales bacterium]|nr:hypothetical protein [Myxococcales bacterium]
MSAADEFLEDLIALEVDVDLLRRDPQGRSWLPASMRARIDADPDCARELAEFVTMELELHGVHVPQQPADVFFTRAVMQHLPKVETVDDRRRTWILASFYSLAIGVAYLLLGPLLSSGELAGWIEPARDWVDAHAVEAGGLWMTAAMLAVACVLVLLPTDRAKAL